MPDNSQESPQRKLSQLKFCFCQINNSPRYYYRKMDSNITCFYCGASNSEFFTLEMCSGRVCSSCYSQIRSHPADSNFECLFCSGLGQTHTFTLQNLQPPGLPQRQGSQVVSTIIMSVQPPDSVSDKINNWPGYYRPFEEFPSSSKTHTVNAHPYDPETRIRRIPRLPQEHSSLLLQSRSSLDTTPTNPAVNQRPQIPTFNHMETRISEQARQDFQQKSIHEQVRYDTLHQNIHTEAIINSQIRLQPPIPNRTDSTGSDHSRPQPPIQPIPQSLIQQAAQSKIQPLSLSSIKPITQPQIQQVSPAPSLASIKPIPQPLIPPSSQSVPDLSQPIPRPPSKSPSQLISQPPSQPQNPAAYLQPAPQPNAQALPSFISQPIPKQAIPSPSQLIPQPASHSHIQPIPPAQASHNPNVIRIEQPQPQVKAPIYSNPDIMHETVCEICQTITGEFQMIFLECGHQVCRDCMHNRIMPIGIQNNFEILCLKCGQLISDQILSANIDESFYDYYRKTKRSLI